MVDLTPTASFRLDGKRALVTGAGRGIGLTAAAALADAGAHVTLLRAPPRRSRKPPRRSARAGKRPTRSCSTSPTRGDAARRIANATPFNILVNNAGTNRPKMLLDVTIEDFDVIMGLNVRAAYFVAQAVARRAGRGQAARLDHQHLVADGPCRRRAPHRLLRVASTPWRASPRRWRSSSRRTTSASTRSGRRSWRRR